MLTRLFGLATAGTLAFASFACEDHSDMEEAAELMEGVQEDKIERAEETREELNELRAAVVYDDREAELFTLEKRLEAIDDRAEATKLAPAVAERFDELEDATEDELDDLNVRDDDYTARAAKVSKNIEQLEAIVDRES